ncbi:MAG TPA: hypothetical protein VE401_11315 [Solirubrobacterales bacterium]|nr:hypothetical protein [Solirubrobacterales bacterium]
MGGAGARIARRGAQLLEHGDDRTHELFVRLVADHGVAQRAAQRAKYARLVDELQDPAWPVRLRRRLI